jgi:glycosyltransferase involved in cell wall biosynthesis
VKDKVLILGNFGISDGNLNGQTVRTRSVFELFKMNGYSNVRFFNTEGLSKKPLLSFKLLSSVFKADFILFMGAQGSLKYLFPLIWFTAYFSGKRIYNIVIGGWLPEYLEKKPILRFLLKRTDGIFCQTQSIVDKLKRFESFGQVYVLPNFRIHKFTPNIKYHKSSPVKLVYLGRIIKSKGYELIFRLAENLSRSLPENSFIIDFYGPIQDDSKTSFLELLAGKTNIRYCGVIQPKDIYEKIGTYDIMLFPTSYPGEGFSGTILDSFIAGIPVIASNWRYNSEIIEQGKTGYIFDLNNEKTFCDYAKKLIQDADLLYQFKLNAYQKSKEFSSEKAWQLLKAKGF